MQQKDGQCNNGYAYREWLHQGLHTEGGHVGPEASELGHDAHSSQPHQPRLAHLCMSDVEEFAHPLFQLGDAGMEKGSGGHVNMLEGQFFVPRCDHQAKLLFKQAH
eukprot:scaffold138805_cov24-Tisochrysis_lutea.AAC.2